MTLQLKIHQFKFAPATPLVLVSNAVNVLMNEVVLDNTQQNKTYVTDALATCAAIAFCSSEAGFNMAFTHMSSAQSKVDDARKEAVLEQMLDFMLKTLPLPKVNMLIAPSTVPEPHLIRFITNWASQKGIKYELLQKGSDSAVFNIDDKGKPLMFSTSLNLKQHSSNKWSGHGPVQDFSNFELEHTYYAAKLKHPLFFKAVKKQKEWGRVAAVLHN